MSNGARLTAVIVVVVVAAIGLSFAFMTPSAKPVHDPLALDGSIAVPQNPGALNEATPLDGTGATGGTAGTPDASHGGVATAGAPVGSVVDPVGGTSSGAAAAAGAAGAGASTTKPAGNAGGVTPTGAGSPTIANTTTPVPTPPVEPAGVEYVVQKGDTLEAIARTRLGDGQKWKSIVALNPGLDPKTLKVGQKIKLPAGATGGEVAAKPAPPAGSEAPAGGNTYTVQKGDTLIAISRKFFGSDADWKRILEANKPLLKGDAGNLQPGMKLTIPAKR